MFEVEVEWDFFLVALENGLKRFFHPVEAEGVSLVGGSRCR